MKLLFLIKLSLFNKSLFVESQKVKIIFILVGISLSDSVKVIFAQILYQFYPKATFSSKKSGGFELCA